MAPGAKVIIAGPIGSGKTTCLRKLVTEAGLEVFMLATDPGHMAFTSLQDDEEFGESVHFAQISTTTKSWKALAQQADDVNRNTSKDLFSMTPDKTDYRGFIEMISLCNNFKDQRGKEYGDVMEWGTNRVLVVDHLTGVCTAVRRLTLGPRTANTKPEIGIMQDNLIRFLDTLAVNARCHVFLLAHVETYDNEITGGVEVRVSTRGCGYALTRTLGTNFTDLIYSVRRDGEFVWDTDNPGFNGLKANNVPWANNQPQDTAALIRRWRERGGVITE